MSMFNEDPDRALARWQAEENERFERERREDRIADYTPAEDPPTSPAMITLARMVLHGSDRDRRDAAKVLAQLVLEGEE